MTFACCRDLRLYEQSLADCDSVPNNAHSVGARLQLITNLEAQLVQSSATIQNMDVKSDVLKSLLPDNKTAEAEVAKARAKMENIRQQLEQARLVCYFEIRRLSIFPPRKFILFACIIKECSSYLHKHQIVVSRSKNVTVLLLN